METDKRTNKRIDDSLKIKFTVHRRDNSSLNFNTLYTKNISAGGFLFYSKIPTDINEIITIKFMLKGSQDITSVDARVVRVESVKDDILYEIGIQLLDIKQSDLDLLKNYIKEKT